MAEDEVLGNDTDVGSDGGGSDNYRGDPGPSVRDSIKEAVSSLESEQSGGDEKPPKDKAKPTKVASGKTGAERDKTAAAKSATTPVSPGTKEANPGATTPSGEAPTAWEKGARDVWAQLPPAVQAAVLKREQDSNAGVQQLKQRYESYDRSLGQLQQEFQRAGVDNAKGLQNLVSWAVAMRQNPVQTLVQLGRAYGVNLNGLNQQGQNGQMPKLNQQTQQILQPFAQSINQLRQQYQQLANQTKQREDAANKAQSDAIVNTWAQDKPHFAAVRQSMGQILGAAHYAAQQGDQSQLQQWRKEDGSVDFDKLYDAAVWANPETRALVQAEELEAKRAATKAAADKQRRAGVSIKTSTPSGAPKAPKDTGKPPSVRESIMAAREMHAVRA